MNKTEKHKSTNYSEAQSTKWLSWIAKNMQEHDQTVFLIEELQISWLPKKLERLIHQVSFIILFGLIGLIGGFLSRVFSILKHSGNLDIISGLVFGLLFGLMFSLAKVNSNISTIELTFWSWSKLKKDYKNALFIGMTSGFVLTCVFGAIIRIIPNLLPDPLNILRYALSNSLGAGLIMVYVSGWNKRLPNITLIPNEGIYLTIRNSKKWFLTGFIIGTISGLYVSLFTYFFIGEKYLIIDDSHPILGIIQFMIIYGIIGAVIGGIWFGGMSVIRHYILRFLIYIRGYGPWNYTHFLDYSVDKLQFMRRVGGGYIFIHRMLLDHFADLE